MKKLRETTVDEVFEIYVLIKQADVRIAKNGKKFIAFTFQDTSGSMDGKYWDASEDEIQRFSAGQVVFLNGKREVYQGNPQVKIIHLRTVQDNEPNDPGLYMESAPIKKDELIEELNQYVFEITNAHWNRIVRYILAKYQKEFFDYPAAKRNHHAFAGGLSFHTVTMLRLAKAICEQYPIINPSLLYSGIILHDLGKVIELSGPVGTEYTLEGNLVGHIVIADEEVVKACMALKIDDHIEDVIVLKHVILSHHGLLEYGSPVRPRVLEAEVLNMIDTMDASIQMLSGSLKQIEPGESTERIFGLDNRSFYLPN